MALVPRAAPLPPAGPVMTGVIPRSLRRGGPRPWMLTANQAGLIAVGEPTIEQGLDKALTKAAKVVKRTVEATTDQITSELQEALKG